MSGFSQVNAKSIGALAVANNLSDVASPLSALENLDASPAGKGVILASGVTYRVPLGAQNGGYYAQANGYAATGPFFVDRPGTISQLGCYIYTAGSTGAVVRIGIYDSNTDQSPNALLVDTGQFAATTTGAVYITLSAALSLSPGLYHAVCVPQGDPTTLPAIVYTSGGIGPPIYNTAYYGYPLASWVDSTVTGALPNPWTSTSMAENPNCVLMVAQ